MISHTGRKMVLTPTILRLTDKPWMVGADDINGDGRKDIVVVHANAVTVWFAGRDGFPAAANAKLSVTGATEVRTGDLDGDGVADIAVGPGDSNMNSRICWTEADAHESACL